MSVAPGTRIGNFEIVALLGAGGMGDVYRARDTKLEREVALKLMPEGYLGTPDRLARFRREAQLLGALNHPNIAALHGLEEIGGATCLVMELVEGSTLTHRLLERALPPDEAMDICRQVAEGLEAAHAKGIIHRDLKPGNIMVTPEGVAKILDFGLARGSLEESHSSDPPSRGSLSSSPTQSGMILGTAGYMSPEQARGKSVDRRTDIWSFGCVLYEALTGRRAFEGETFGDSLVGVLEHQPDWRALPPGTPAGVRTLLRRCLEKQLNRRLRDAGDARLELEDALSGRGEADAALSGKIERASPWRARLPWVLAAILALACAVALWEAWKRRAPQPELQLQANLTFPEGWSFAGDSTPALSRDGKRLAFILARGGTRQIFVRLLAQMEATPVPGTEGASFPMFSPDGNRLAFFAGGKLKTVALAGGTPETLCDAPHGRGGCWGEDGRIVFSPSYDAPLHRVPAGGGVVEKLTSLDQERGDGTHRWPEVLPDGKTVLYTVVTIGESSFEEARILAQSIETGTVRTVVERGSYPRYLASGYLLYSRDRALMALPFDSRSLQPRGEPIPILEGVRKSIGTGAASFACSETGLLVYAPAGAEESNRTLVRVDRKGSAVDLPAPQRFYQQAKLSPDGERAVVQIDAPDGSAIWVYDMAGGQLQRITFGGACQHPIWSPDGRELVYLLHQGDRHRLVSTPAEGGGSVTPITESRRIQIPGSIAPDGSALAYAEIDPVTRWDIWVVPLQGEKKPRPLFRTTANEADPHFSPDGRWLAYNSNETGRDEIYVTSYPGLEKKWQVSTEGGIEARWSASGREIFFRNSGKVMALDVGPGPAFRPAKARPLLEGRYEYGYDVTRDGSRLLMIRRSEPEMPVTRLNLLAGWRGELGPSGR